VEMEEGNVRYEKLRRREFEEERHRFKDASWKEAPVFRIPKGFKLNSHR